MTEGGKRRLAAIVIADVVGYSRLVGADEIGALAGLRAHRGELIDPLIARKSITHRFQRVVEWAVTASPKRYWEIVGRTAPAHPLQLAT